VLTADSTIDPFAPQAEARTFQLGPHQGDDLRLGESKLKFNGLKGSAVLPGHFNDSVKVPWGKVSSSHELDTVMIASIHFLKLLHDFFSLVDLFIT
jgi:hypothetical protein